MERTLIILKPDAVQRGLSGEILRRFEARGLKIVAMKFMQITRSIAERHYEEHQGKGFYEPLLGYITSSPSVVLILEGKRAVATARQLIGKTDPLEAEVGTIRGDLGMERGRNLVHGSDSVESATREITIFFTEDEIAPWTPVTEAWVYE